MGMMLVGLLKALDASHFVIGLSNFLVMAAGLGQIFSSSLAERSLRRIPLLTRFFQWRMLFLLIPGSLILARGMGLSIGEGLITSLVLISVGVSHLLFSLAYPMWFSLATDLLPPSVKGSFFGRLQAVGQVMQAILIVTLGWGLQNLSENELIFFGCFWIFAGLGQWLGAILNQKVQEPPMTPSTHGNSFLKNVREIFQLDAYRRLLWICCLFNFSVAFATTFGVVYFRDVLELGWWPISMIAASWALTFGLASPLWGLIIDRMGNSRTLVALGLILLGLSFCGNILVQQDGVSLGWIHLQSEPLVIALASISGLGFACWFVCVTHLQSELTPVSNRTMLVGVFNAICSLVGASGALIVGFCMDYLGLDNMSYLIFGLKVEYFQFSHLLAGLSFLLLIPLVYSIRRPEENGRLILSTVFGGGLFQNVLNVWRFHQLEDETGMVRLLKKSSKGASTRLLLPDLLKRLDDPSEAIQVESIYALGRLGDSRAVPALLEMLDEASSGLEFEILWALGEIRDSRAIEPLFKILEKANADVSRRACLSLARLDLSPSDEGRMLALLRKDLPSSLSLTLIESLLDRGRIHELRSYLFSAYLCPATNRQRRRLAMGVAQSYGCRADLYRSLREEEKAEGSSFESLSSDRRLSLLFNDLDPEEQGDLLFKRCLALMEGELKEASSALENLENPERLDQLLAIHLIRSRLSVKDRQTGMGMTG